MNRQTIARIAVVFIIVVLFMMIVAFLAGCGNRQYVDMVRTYDKAIVEMPGGEVLEIELRSWRDYDGEQIQLVATDGTVYLVSSFNCVLVRD